MHNFIKDLVFKNGKQFIERVLITPVINAENCKPQP